jgi:hypothetical protein
MVMLGVDNWNFAGGGSGEILGDEHQNGAGVRKPFPSAMFGERGFMLRPRESGLMSLPTGRPIERLDVSCGKKGRTDEASGKAGDLM